MLVFVEPATQNIIICVLGLGCDITQKMTRFPIDANLTSRICQMKTYNSTSHCKNCCWIIRARICSETLQFQRMLPRNCIVERIFSGVFPRVYEYLDPKLTCNSDKTISTVDNTALLIFWLLLDNNLQFSGAVSCFLRRHLPRLSSL